MGTDIPKTGIGRIHVTMGMGKRTLQKVAQFLTRNSSHLYY